MDIKELYTKDRAEQGAWCDIKDPAGKETGLKFKVAGAHSETFRREMSKARAAQINRQKARGQRDVTPADVEIEFDLMAEVLAAITLEWNAESNGEDFPLTRENAKLVFENAPDVRRQVFEFASDTRNYFLSNSSGNV